jgi:uncharacterized DUF497 family protein
MDAKLSWDETKRLINLRKHGLDFALAGVVLDSRYRLDIPVVRGTESLTLSISYAMGFLAVLTVVHTARDASVRVISFRRASREEREAYLVWIENECDEPQRRDHGFEGQRARIPLCVGRP